MDSNMLGALSDSLVVPALGTAAIRRPIRVNALKYRDWQVLAYEGVLGRQPLQKEKLMYDE